MPTDNAVPSADPSDLLFNAQKFDEFVTGGAYSYTDRLGVSRFTISGALRAIGYEVPVAFTTGLNISRATQTVTSGGLTYHAAPSALPFITTGTFNPAQWMLLSNVTRDEVVLKTELADPSSTNGANLVAFQLTATGAAARTAFLKLSEGPTVSVLDFAGDGVVTDYSAAVNAALTHLITIGGGTLFVPGWFRVKSQIVKTISAQQHINIVGLGRYVSGFDFSGSNTLGIWFDSTTTAVNAKPTFELRDLGLITSRKNCGTAYRVSYADAVTISASVTIDNVAITQNINRVSDAGADYGYWSRLVHLTNARNSRINNLHGFGEMNLAPQTTHGVYLDGECTATQVTNSLIMEAVALIEATGTTEGLSVINNDLLYGRYGVYHHITSGGEPQCTVIGGSINCANVNVWLSNSIGSVVKGVLHFAAAELDTGTWPEWTGVLVDGANSRHIDVEGCTFTKNASRTGDVTNAIDFNNGHHHRARGNTTFGFSGNQITNGIICRSTVSDVIVDETNQFDHVATRFTSTGVRCFRQQTTQAGRVTVATGTAVTFPQAFEAGSLPIVQLTHEGTNTGINALPTGISESGFTVAHNGVGSVVINWIAAGNI
jgi:hypothetical protein